MKLIVTFELPLRCAPLLNVYSRMHWSRRASIKKEAYLRMLSQASRRKQPLPGKPRVVFTRYSSKVCDQDASATKIPLDCLRADAQGLGYIRDDDPNSVDVQVRWGKAAPGSGRVIIEVYA